MQSVARVKMSHSGAPYTYVKAVSYDAEVLKPAQPVSNSGNIDQ